MSLSLPRVLVIQHEETVPPALFGHWLAEAGMCVDVCRAYAEPIPPLSSLDASYSGLLVMGGSMQTAWQHSVPKVHRPIGGRISLQWRWTSQLGRQEVGGSYRKPRHYSR